MMAVETIESEIRNLRARVEGSATALIACNGALLAGELPTGTNAEAFAVLCATAFGAAVAASAELSSPPPTRIVIEDEVSTTILARSGEKTLLVAVVDRSADRTRVLDEVGRTAEHLRTD